MENFASRELRLGILYSLPKDAAAGAGRGFAANHRLLIISFCCGLPTTDYALPPKQKSQEFPGLRYVQKRVANYFFFFEAFFLEAFLAAFLGADFFLEAFFAVAIF